MEDFRVIIDIELDYERDFVWSDDIIILPDIKPCYICDTPTFFGEEIFGEYICSRECEDAIWEEYFEANLKWIRGEGNKPKVRRSNSAP